MKYLEKLLDPRSLLCIAGFIILATLYATINDMKELNRVMEEVILELKQEYK